MIASPGDIKLTLWQWPTVDFEAEPLFPALRLELRAWFVQRFLCNQGSHKTLQPATLPAFFRLAASDNIFQAVLHLRLQLPLVSAAPPGKMIETESHQRLTILGVEVFSAAQRVNSGRGNRTSACIAV